MEILRCEGVRKIYGSGAGQVAALDGIDLSVEKGEFTAVMGLPAPENPHCFIFWEV